MINIHLPFFVLYFMLSKSVYLGKRKQKVGLQ